MKRILFKGVLLTTMAVGAAFFGNAQSSRLLIFGGPLNTNAPCNTNEVDCSPTGDIQCTVMQGSETIPLFAENTLTSKCTVPLFFVSK